MMALSSLNGSKEEPSKETTKIVMSKNGLFEPFKYKNKHFTKTGSGQT
jgi:hypothetical protein